MDRRESKRQRLRELLGPEREREPEVHIGDIIITNINDRSGSEQARDILANIAKRIHRR